MGSKMKEQCYKTAKTTPKYSYFGQIIDFNDSSHILL